MFFGKERRIKNFVKRVNTASDSKQKYAYVIQEFKKNKLYSGSGQKVKSIAQARAIAQNMAYGTTRKKSKKAKPIQKKSSFLVRLKKIIFNRSS